MDPVAFVREGSDRRGLGGLDVGVCGDVLDAGSVLRATVHKNLAANPDDVVQPAVEGTKNALDAAKGVRRVVYTSSAATIGFTPDPARALRGRLPREGVRRGVRRPWGE
jgi:hypothetical protein